MQIHLSDLLMYRAHEYPPRGGSVGPSTDRWFATGIQHLLVRWKQGASLRKVPKKCEVTWCYNPQEDLTLFGSTLVVRHNKLVDRPVGRAVVKRRALMFRLLPVGDASGCSFPPHARTESDVSQC